MAFRSLRTALVCMTVSASLYGTPSLAATNLVTNGDFESGTLSAFSQVGNPMFAGVVAGTFNGLNPTSGNAHAFFGAMGSLGGISQVLATIPGALYTISFDLATFGGGPNAYKFDFGSVNLDTVANVQPFNYTHFSYTATALTSSTLLALQFRNDPSNFLLDNISVSAVAVNAAVPELSTWALMLLGFAAVGGAMRRRSVVTRRLARISF